MVLPSPAVLTWMNFPLSSGKKAIRDSGGKAMVSQLAGFFPLMGSGSTWPFGFPFVLSASDLSPPSSAAKAGRREEQRQLGNRSN